MPSAFYQPSFDLIDMKITPLSSCKKIEVWLNVFFKVIDISMKNKIAKNRKLGKVSNLFEPDLL